MVSNICHYFVVDNGVHFKQQLPQLYFVPCYTTVKMQRVWCVIQSSLLNKGHYVGDLLSTIENIYCDSVETKIVALEKLRHCLDAHSSSLTSALSTDEVHPIFEMIVTCLLDNASNKNPLVKTLCAVNLGELGAVNPLKFGFNDGSKSYSPQKYDLTADDFSVICVTKIVHCLGKYDDSKIVSVLYSTIQELLRIQFADKNDDDKRKYFDKFSVQDQHILQPLLQSKYIFKGVKMDKQSLNPITFGLHTVKTPSEWASLWASQMLSRMPTSLGKTLFGICLPAMFVDLDVTETVLPYILLYALIDCSSSDVDLIEKEMKYILRWDVSKHRTKPDNVMTIVGETSKTVVHSDVSQTKYVAVILDLLNFLEQAMSDRFFFGAALSAASKDIKIDERVADFLSRFPNRAMSQQSFVQNDYTRSLYYFEKSSSNETNSNLKPLRNIYSKLNDVDGLVGVTKSSTIAPTTEEMIVNHTVSGALQSAIAGYERLSVKYQSTNVYRGLIQCYININQPITALAVSKQIVDDNRYLKPDVFSERVEAAWNSMSCEDLNDLDTKFLDGRSWSVDLVNIFRLLSQTEYTVVLDKLKSIRLGIVGRLTDLNRNGMNLYRAGYWYMVKLHILNDIEHLSQNLFSLPKQNAVLDVDWERFERRLSLLPSHGPYAQDVRKVHLQTLDVFLNAVNDKLSRNELDKFKSHLGAMWLHMSKRARTNKNFQGAYTCLGIAEKYEPPELFIEMAKYYQSTFDTEAAVLTLQQGLVRNDVDRKIRAKAKLLTASFNVGNMNLDFNDGYAAFKEAAETYNLEKSFVSLASYLYRQHLTENEPDNTAAKRFIQIDSARNFSKSLLYGSKHVYQSMPCLLSLWLDYGARAAKKSKKSNDSGITSTLSDFNGLMENNLLCLPSAVFVTAFSQILSRINHRQSSCFEILKSIIVRIIREHHRQALWSFVAVCRSTNHMQKKRADEICQIVKNGDPQLSTYFKHFNALVDKLVDICSKKLKYSRKVTLTQICPGLKVVIDGSRSSPIMLPLQKFLTVNVCDKESDNGPFISNPVTIVDVKNDVLMLHSAQMPLRLEFVGSDGEIYPILCKKDDLRLDSRIMEFNSVINGLLRRDVASCEKGLSIRTYGVVPLTSECGVIEWLSGLTSLKGLVGDMYSKLGMSTMPMSQIKKLMLVQKGEVEISERLRRYVELILPKHPPVLHKWFFERHPSPDDWYNCRSAFVKSSAVMSIVGYIVGLGDRHGENILIDSKSGEAVHVDFNCMFNRSDLLYYPETVPFRLTHSMVRAMGSTGVEGPFLISCEATNHVMRRHYEQLLSVMKPFLYDLDVKTARKTSRDSSDVLDDQSNDEAKINIRNVEMRLNGVVRCKNDQWAPHRNTKPLSVEGQTRMLIKEATSEMNLCQMFAGWAPYM